MRQQGSRSIHKPVPRVPAGSFRGETLARNLRKARMGGQYANEVSVTPVLPQPTTEDPGSIPIGPGLRHYSRWRFCVSSHARSTRVLKCRAAADRMGQSHRHRNEVSGQRGHRPRRNIQRRNLARKIQPRRHEEREDSSLLQTQVGLGDLCAFAFQFGFSKGSFRLGPGCHNRKEKKQPSRKKCDSADRCNGAEPPAPGQGQQVKGAGKNHRPCKKRPTCRCQ